MGEFNSDDIVSTTMGKKPLDKMEYPSKQSKSQYSSAI